jgi:hypothetical protein
VRASWALGNLAIAAAAERIEKGREKEWGGREGRETLLRSGKEKRR